jgi:membrane-bound lytic murein transglycosylase A
MIHSIAAPLRGFAPLLAAVLAACVTAPPPSTTDSRLPAQFVRTTFADLPGYAADRVSEAWPAFLAGCRALVANPRHAPVWQAPCTAALGVRGSDEQAVRAYFAAHFSPYVVTSADGRRDGLVTGYYEPVLAGSRERTSRFTVPLYGVPDDLLLVDLASLYPELGNRRVRGRLEGRRVVPYWPRAEIEAGHVNARPLAFVEHPLDAFFLQIQGSGRIALADGSVMRIGYADQNGHPYRAVANVLIERGEMTLQQASMQAIREWGARNPERLASLLDENPSYVFFREIAPPPPGTLEASIDGPQGSLGVPLLAGRTIAVDARALPLGAPVWLATTYPATGAELSRLVLAQDTGGAIRGAVRADFFWGAGDEAGAQAGRMRQRGYMWLLWPNGAPLP